MGRLLPVVLPLLVTAPLAPPAPSPPVRPPVVALVGNPNSGKTSLFNALTGMRQRVGNYSGVTVERVEGRYRSPSGRAVRVLDLPGTYSLNPKSLDERVAYDVLVGRMKGEPQPDGSYVSYIGVLQSARGRGVAKPYWPEKLVVLDDFPKTPSGKIQKFVLRDQVSGGV